MMDNDEQLQAIANQALHLNDDEQSSLVFRIGHTGIHDLTDKGYDIVFVVATRARFMDAIKKAYEAGRQDAS